MSLPIKADDKVLITYNNYFCWLPGSSAMVNEITATVVYTPCDVGDMWKFKTDDGIEFAQNPQSSNLDKIVLLESAPNQNLY